MKKAFALLLALAAALSLAACGGGTDHSPAPIQSGGEAQSAPASAEREDPAALPPMPEVEVKGGKIISTDKSTDSVTEYTYENGTLTSIVLTIHCGSAELAKSSYEEMIAGSAKEMTEQSYSDVRLDGKDLVCTMNGETVSLMGSFSQEEMAALLRGEEPVLSGGGSGGAIPAFPSGGFIPDGAAYTGGGTVVDVTDTTFEGVQTYNVFIQGAALADALDYIDRLAGVGVSYQSLAGEAEPADFDEFGVFFWRGINADGSLHVILSAYDEPQDWYSLELGEVKYTFSIQLNSADLYA